MSDWKDKLAAYQSHKVVRAAQVLDVEPAGRAEGPPGTALLRLTQPGMNEVFEADIDVGTFARGWPSPGDYIILYRDDYISWSPRTEFEDGYTRTPPSP